MNRLNLRIKKLPLPTISILTEIDGLNGQWVGGAKLSPQVLGRLKRSVLATSTGASTRIEGAKLTDEEVEKLMRGLSTQKMKDRDAQEVRGYYETLAFIFDNWKNIELNENIIKQLHSDLLKYSQKDERQRGEYKKLDNSVVATDSNGNVVSTIFDTTPAYLTPKEMSELISWTTEALNQKNYHPLTIISNFVVEFLKIHPFLDGNGRLSRILTSLLLLQAGYEYVPYVSQEKLIESQKAEYYIALRQSQTSFKTENETIAPWSEFILGIFREQAAEAIGLLSNELIDRTLSPKQLIVWQYIQTKNEVTIRDITNATKVARPTVRQAVNRLHLLKKIERIGLGRTTRYRKL
ncbi:MAG TPA: Fic family protein [Candidatus Saccharimonadia bacterium]|nr:Fic family protein [Candidatus Saccharimonadia bacterium]